MLDDSTIKKFARNVLKCNCPEEVFKTIVCEDNFQIDNSIIVSHKINIGNRLLVYVSVLDEKHGWKSILNELVNSGERVRNEKGFNRFRLVFACTNVDKIKDELNASFDRLNKDDKIHLHVIHTSDFPS